MDLPTTPGLEAKVKSFWARPEGKVGMIGIGILGIFACMILYRILPAIILLAQNTIYAMGLLAVIGAILFMVFDPKVRTLVSFMYKSVIRMLTGWFITIDPIGILKNYLGTLRTNLGKMDQQIGRLKGEMRKVKTQIDENSSGMADAMTRAKKAQETQKQEQFILQSRQAGRLQKSTMTLQSLYTKMELLYRALDKMYKVCAVLYEDTGAEIDCKEKEWNAVRAAHSAMTSAMAIMRGSSSELDLKQQTLDYMADDLGNKVGEMERFMDTAQSFMDSVDLDNLSFEEKGLAMLEQWEKQADSLLLPPPAKAELSQLAYNPKEVLEFDQFGTKEKVTRKYVQ
jgi:hypothetical protein